LDLGPINHRLQATYSMPADTLAGWRDYAEELFEFAFGANGRINRAKYWRSVLIYICMGLVTTIVLFTAVGIAAPPFIIEVVVELFPWLLWDFFLHDGAAA
jgi:uncharacterized membrane protein YhaH (DUF805 family)